MGERIRSSKGSEASQTALDTSGLEPLRKRPSAFPSGLSWGCSSAGRALESHSRGRRFDPVQLHQSRDGPGSPGPSLLARGSPPRLARRAGRSASERRATSPASSTTRMKRRNSSCRSRGERRPSRCIWNHAITSTLSDESLNSVNRTLTPSGQIRGCARSAASISSRTARSCAAVVAVGRGRGSRAAGTGRAPRRSPPSCRRASRSGS